MKTIHAALTVLALTLAGCGLLGNTSDDTPIDWPSVVQCVPTDAVLSLVDIVADIFLARSGDGIEVTDDATGELEDLARKHGPGVVACAVDTVMDGWSRPGAAQHPDRMAATLRGRDFLSDIGTTIERPE